MCSNQNKESLIYNEDKSERLDTFLSGQFPEYTRSKWNKNIKEHQVLVNNGSASPSHKLKKNDIIHILQSPSSQIHNLEPIDIPLDIVYEDSSIIIINKPRGLITHPAPSTNEPTLVHALLHYQTNLSSGTAPFRPGIVHRLDKDTTGLIIVAKTDAAHNTLADQIQDRTLQRSYLTWCDGIVANDKFTVEAPIGRHPQNPLKMAIVENGKYARTTFEVLSRENNRSLLLAKLDTGRTHQIRIHLESIGHPVIGDPIYSSRQINLKSKQSSLPLQLHAAFLSLIHPVTKNLIEFSAKLPENFITFDDSILKNRK